MLDCQQYEEKKIERLSKSRCVWHGNARNGRLHFRKCIFHSSIDMKGTNFIPFKYAIFTIPRNSFTSPAMLDLTLARHLGPILKSRLLQLGLNSFKWATVALRLRQICRHVMQCENLLMLTIRLVKFSTRSYPTTTSWCHWWGNFSFFKVKTKCNQERIMRNCGNSSAETARNYLLIQFW